MPYNIVVEYYVNYSKGTQSGVREEQKPWAANNLYSYLEVIFACCFC